MNWEFTPETHKYNINSEKQTIDIVQRVDKIIRKDK